MIYIAGPGHGGPGAGREHLSRRHVQRDLSGHLAGRATGCRSCSSSSRFPAAFRATSRRRRRARSTKAASSATRCRTRIGAAFDNPDLIVACVDRRRRSRDRPARDELALEQVPQSGARRRGAADPAPERLQDRRPDGARAHSATTSSTQLLRGYGYEPYFVEGDDPRDDASADGGDARRGRRTRFAASSSDARTNGFTRAPALADDRAAHAERLDRPEGRRRQAGRGTLRAHQVPLAELAKKPEHLQHARAVDAELRARGAVRRERAAASRARRARAAGRRAAWARTRTRTAGCCCAICACPTSATTRSTCRAPGAVDAEATRVPGQVPPRRACARTPTRATSASFGPDETASNRWNAVFEVTDRVLDRRDHARRRPRRARRPRDGNAERASVPGLARGLSADRPPRLLLLLRGVHPHRRFDVQPAREVARRRRATFRGAGRSPRSTTC